jgi:hypothetical protein
MASYGNTNQPFHLPRSISMRSATTIDGFMVIANKHLTDDIEGGTLQNALDKGYINDNDANKAIEMKKRHDALNIMKIQSP